MAQANVPDNAPPFPALLTFQDADGNTVPPDDIPVWATSDATIATISSTTPDGTGATIAIAGRSGSCTLTATSVNKSGTKIVMTGSVVVGPGDAVQGEMTFPAVTPPATVPPANPTTPSASAAPSDTTPSSSSSGSGTIPSA